MSYPDKFVVKSKYCKWDVEKNKDGTFDFIEGIGGHIGAYTAQRLDELKIICDYEFIFPEPEMVFPFTFKCKVLARDWDGDGTYTAYQGSTESRVRITHTNGHDVDDQYTKDCVKKYIKDGDWIVTSVGEPKKLASTTIEELVVKVNSDGVELATERFKKLAEVVEAVNISLESMQQLLGEIGGVTKDEVILQPVQDYSGFNINLNDFLKGK